MIGEEARGIDFFEALRGHARARPADIALEVESPEGRESFDWARLTKEVQALALYLQSNGVSPGDRVAILMENHPRWAVTFMAVQSAGGVAVPLDTMADADSLIAVSKHAQLSFLIASPQFSTIANRILDENTELDGLLATKADWTSAVTFGASELPLVQRLSEDPLVILYTGGTTGKPKGVLLTRRNLYSSVTAMLQVFPLSSRDRILSVLPLFHVMPLLANLIAPLYMGARVFYLNQLDPESLMRAFSGEAITAFLCVPQFYYQIQRRILDEVDRQPVGKKRLFHFLLAVSRFLRRTCGLRAGRIFFQSIHLKFGIGLRALGIGGAYFNPKSAEFFSGLGFSLFQAYGLTECSGLASVTPPDRNGGLSCGRAAVHCELRIANPDPQGVGEILIRGENIMQGYWRDPDATSHVIRDGWLHTGDLGTLDSRGVLRLTGRGKDVIVLSSGKNIFPEELEEIYLGRCNALQEICFVGVENQEGATLHCVAVPNRERFSEASPDEKYNQVRSQIAAVARELPAHKRPGSLMVTDQSLPRTTTRKLQRFRIGELAATVPFQTNVDAPPKRSEDLLECEISRLIARIRPVSGEINRHKHLALDLNLDSLQRVELLVSVEIAFGTRINPEVAARIEDVGDLVDAVKAAKSGVSGHAEWTSWTELVRRPLSTEECAYAEAYLRRRPVMETGLYYCGRLLALVLRCFWRLKIEHSSDGFPSAPFLICPNHSSHLDGPVIASCLTLPIFRRMFGLAASKYFRGFPLSSLLALFRVLPVDKDRHLVQGLRMAKAGLEQGLVLCMFPEGTRTYDGKRGEMHKGVAILACALRLPVVPVGIAGAFEAWPRTRSLPALGRVAISLGEALTADSGEPAEAFIQRLSAAIERQFQTAVNLRNS